MHNQCHLFYLIDFPHIFSSNPHLAEKFLSTLAQIVKSIDTQERGLFKTPVGEILCQVKAHTLRPLADSLLGLQNPKSPADMAGLFLRTLFRRTSGHAFFIRQP